MTNRRLNISRRELLKRAGIVGAAAAVVPVGSLAPIARVVASSAATPLAQAGTSPGEAWETLTAPEADTLEAIVTRLIPSDENGPGAREARAAHYIDRALGGALASWRDAYRSGLDAVGKYAQASKGASFARLPPADQDAILRDMENDVATGFAPDASTFFNLLRAHTIQGTFCDPYYGGNANFVGWDLIRYPGVRLAVSANEQRMNVKLTTTRRSAYDHAMFAKKRPSRARLSVELRPWRPT